MEGARFQGNSASTSYIFGSSVLETLADGYYDLGALCKETSAVG